MVVLEILSIINCRLLGLKTEGFKFAIGQSQVVAMKWLQSDGKLSNGMMTVKGSVSDLVRRGTALHWLGPLAFSLPLRGNANCNSKGSFYKLSYTFNLPRVSTSCCYDHGRAHCLFFLLDASEKRGSAWKRVCPPCTRISLRRFHSLSATVSLR